MKPDTKIEFLERRIEDAKQDAAYWRRSADWWQQAAESWRLLYEGRRRPAIETVARALPVLINQAGRTAAVLIGQLKGKG